MKKLLKQFSAGFLAIALVFSAIPPIQASAETAPTITGITFEDEIIPEGQDAYEEAEGKWYYHARSYNYEIQLSNGESLTKSDLSEEGYCDYEEFEYDGVRYWINYQTNQSEENYWGPGTHSVTGYLYYRDEYQGDHEGEAPAQPICSDTFDYTIIAIPIKTITFEPVTRVANSNGEWRTDWIDGGEDENGYESEEYFHYGGCNNWNYTVEFTDDTPDYVKQNHEDEDIGFMYDGVYVDLSFESNQSYEKRWLPGNTYQVKVTAGTYETTYDITIIDVPIKEIVLEPKEVVEGTNGYWDFDWLEDETQTPEYYRYSDYENWNYTVKFSDDTADYVHTDDDWDLGFYYGDQYVEMEFSASQSYDNQWKVGVHKIKVTAGTYETTYDYNIVESPVKSIEVKPVKLLEKTGGYYSSIWDDDGEERIGSYYYYGIDADNVPYAVILKDGKKVNSDEDGYVTINGKDYRASFNDDQSSKNPWGVGQHEATISIMGQKENFKVNILCGEHVWDKGTTTTAPTCTAKGEITYKCTKAGCTETKTALVNAKGHKPGAAATCTAPQTCVDCGAILAVPTGHTAGPDATCTTAQNCAKCGAELEKVKGHAVALKTIAKANVDENGEIVETCICGQVMSNSAIAKVSTAKMAKTKYAYAGKAIAPAVTVKDAAGKILVVGTDYDVTYKNNNKVGKATATVKFKGNYSGSKKLTYTINPAKPTIKKPVAGKKALTAKWSKVSKQATGYEVMIATNKKFSKNKKTVIVKSFKTTSKKISKLKSKKTYYVKVRTYKTVGKVKYYSDWSAVKKVKVK